MEVYIVYIHMINVIASYFSVCLVATPEATDILTTQTMAWQDFHAAGTSSAVAMAGKYCFNLSCLLIKI